MQNSECYTVIYYIIDSYFSCIDIKAGLHCCHGLEVELFCMQLQLVIIFILD